MMPEGCRGGRAPVRASAVGVMVTALGYTLAHVSHPCPSAPTCPLTAVDLDPQKGSVSTLRRCSRDLSVLVVVLDVTDGILRMPRWGMRFSS